MVGLRSLVQFAESTVSEQVNNQNVTAYDRLRKKQNKAQIKPNFNLRK